MALPHSLSTRGATANSRQRIAAFSKHADHATRVRSWQCARRALARALAGWLIGVFAACAMAPVSVQAQSFTLPVDLEQGLVFGSNKPRTPYIFGAHIVPSIDVNRARFGMVLAPMYRNPKWDFAVGARMSLFAPVSGKKLGVRFELQGEYLPVQRAGRVSFGAVAELFGLLRVGLWPAFDFDVMRPELCVSIGADIMSWAHVLSDDL